MMKLSTPNAGTLYLIGTPIGNLEDITLRALRVLKEVDCIAAEDTRTARKLLSRYEIHTPTISYYDAKEKQKSRKIVARLKSGENVALISEAGMPGISDPGYRLVEEAISSGIQIVPIPGPSALLTALVISGLPTNRFIFEGFPPAARTALRKKIFLLQDEEPTLIFYESPRRLLATLGVIKEIIGERRVVVARELTKKFEEVLRGTAGEIIDRLQGREIKGEIVLLVEGRKRKPAWDHISASEQIEQVEKDLGISRMEAIKLVAELRGISKSEIYREYQLTRIIPEN